MQGVMDGGMEGGRVGETERVCRDARPHLSALQHWEGKGWRGRRERERDDGKQVEGVKEHGNREEGRRIRGKMK